MIEIELKTDKFNTKCYFIKGTEILHREDGPATEYANGRKEWWQNDKRHRVDGPAIEYANGTKEWYQNDKCHRLDGPAAEYTNGEKLWLQHDKYHRLDGPAIEEADGTKIWYLDGEMIDCTSQQQFKKLLKLKVFW